MNATRPLARFALFVKSRREQLRLTQDDLAEAMSVERSYISHLESGRVKMPSRAILQKLSDVLNTPLSDMVLLVYDVEKAEADMTFEERPPNLKIAARDRYIRPETLAIIRRLAEQDWREWKREQEELKRLGRKASDSPESPIDS